MSDPGEFNAVQSFLYRDEEDVIELHAVGHTSTQTFPYDEVSLQGWHKRAKVVYPVPSSIAAAYYPLTSRTWKRLCKYQPDTSSADPFLTIVGDIGLGLVLDDTQQPKITVEAAALYELITSMRYDDKYVPTSKPSWLRALDDNWTHQMSLFIFDEKTGWRGCFAEHRLWSASMLRSEEGQIKTPYSSPAVRGWFPLEILRDLQECVGKDLVHQIHTTVAENGFDGSPDLVLYNQSCPYIWFVEVKSVTDTLRAKQLQMMQSLSKLERVKCQICCPKLALKRFLGVLITPQYSDESD